MNFKIRRPDSDTKEEYESSQKMYFKHLAAFDQKLCPDLWKFFTWDTFHDGTIYSISFNPDLKTVKIELNCPNIERSKPDGGFEYVDTDFTCIFYDVIRFCIEDSEPSRKLVHDEGTSTYRNAEINTCTPKMKFLTSGGVYSILIETCGGHTRWIEVVFRHLTVSPKEPLAFSMAEADPSFKIPTYRPDA